MSDSAHAVLQPPAWVLPRGFSNGIAASGKQVFIAGQIGWNAKGEFESGAFVDQARQALQNIVEVLREAGGRPCDIVRLTWYVLDKHEYLKANVELGRAYRAVMGDHYPAMTLVAVAALVEDAARVEIEATAVVPER